MNILDDTRARVCMCECVCVWDIHNLTHICGYVHYDSTILSYFTAGEHLRLGHVVNRRIDTYLLGQVACKGTMPSAHYKYKSDDLVTVRCEISLAERWWLWRSRQVHFNLSAAYYRLPRYVGFVRDYPDNRRLVHSSVNHDKCGARYRTWT